MCYNFRRFYVDTSEQQDSESSEEEEVEDEDRKVQTQLSEPPLTSFLCYLISQKPY